MKITRIYFLTIAVLLIISPAVLKSQEYSGTVKYTITHDRNKKMLASEFITDADRENSTYVWGQYNEYIEYSILEFSPSASIYKMKEEDQSEYGYSWRSVEYIIYRNFEENTTYDVIKTLNKLYLIEDSIRYPNWKIRNDMREIAGHICMNAYYRDTIKEKDIIAWFALDIPVKYGPDRFGGLPGMILEIDMNNGALVISASEIIMSEEKKEIEKPTHKKKVKNVTEAEYNEIIYKFVQESKKNKRPYYYSIDY